MKSVNMKKCNYLACAHRVALLAGIWVTATVLLVAQSRTTSLTGLISDPKTLPVPKATVLVSNQATGVTITLQTNGEGLYQVDDLVPGSYRVEVSAPGFKTEVRAGLLLETGQTGRFDAVLQVGEVNETVEITDAAPLLQTEGSELVGEIVTDRQLDYLPDSDRKFPTLFSLSALTTSAGEQSFGHSYPVMAGSGAEGTNTGFYLNGGQSVDVASVSPVYAFSTQFVAEFTMVTNSTSAQYEGNNAVQLTTKGGTNAFHGNGNFYIQDAALNTTPWGSAVNLPFRDDEWGVQLGGPIRKNKTFFFAGYQRATYDQTLPAFLTMPTTSQIGGDFSETVDANGNVIPIYDPATTVCSGGTCTRQQFPGNIIPPDRVDPVAAKILGFFPAPTQQGTIGGGNNYVTTRATSQATPMYSVRVDQQWNNTDRTFVSLNNNNFLATYPSGFHEVGFRDADNLASNVNCRMYQLTATNDYTPNPHWMLDTSFALQGFWQEYVDDGYNKGFPAQLGLHRNSKLLQFS